MTSANYAEAIGIGKQRFAQRQVIVYAHMESLLHLQAVSRERDIITLRRLYDNIKSNGRSLKSLSGPHTRMNNAQLQCSNTAIIIVAGSLNFLNPARAYSLFWWLKDFFVEMKRPNFTLSRANE